MKVVTELHEILDIIHGRKVNLQTGYSLSTVNIHAHSNEPLEPSTQLMAELNRRQVCLGTEQVKIRCDVTRIPLNMTD